MAELVGRRREAYVESRRRLGLRQRVFFQSTTIGDMSLVTLAGKNPRAIHKWFESDEPLARWITEQVAEFSGIDLSQPQPDSAGARLVVDSEKATLQRAA